MKKEKLSTILYILAVIIYSVFNISYLIYLVYFVQVLTMVIKTFVERRNITGDELTKILIYSLILPDNYICIAVAMILALLGFIRGGIKNVKWFCVVFIILIINVIAWNVSLLKIVLSIMYYVAFFAAWKFFDAYNLSKKKIIDMLINIIWIQVAAIMAFALSHLDVVKSTVDLDWVTGSFGAFQCNILNIVCTFVGIVMLRYFMESKKKKYLFYTGMSLALTMITGSVSITIFFVVSCVFTIILNIKKLRKRTICIITGGIVGLIVIFVNANDSWVTKDILDLLNKDYFKNRVQKVQTYEDVFVNIPANDFKFRIIGGGLGNFSSRTALTCTGEYIDAYNRLFEVEMSEYTEKYVYPQFYKVLYLSDNLWGVTYTPYSTIISIKGELGIVGLILFLCMIVRMYKGARKSYTATCAITYLVLLFFIDNYMEFPKVVIAFWMCYYFCIEKTDKSKNETQKKEDIVLIGSIEECALNGPKQIVKKLDEQYRKRKDINYTSLLLGENNRTSKILYFIKLIKTVMFSKGKKISVHSDGYKIPLIVLILSKINIRNDYFYTVHGLRCVENRIYGIKRNVMLEKVLICGFSNIICVSKMLCEDIKKEYGRSDRIYSITNGIDVDSIKNNEVNKEKNKIISVGGINRVKGIFEQLELINWLVNNKNANLEFHIWGSVENENIKKKFDEYIDNNNLSKNVFFNGYMKDKECLMQIYDTALINLCLSNYDTFNMSVLEAMSRGCLVIVSNKCGAKELVNGKNGTVITNFDKDRDSVYEYLLKLQDNSFCQECVINAVNTVANVTWEKITDQYINLMRKDDGIYIYSISV